MTTWGEQYVDQQIEQAWMRFRLALADRLQAGIDAGHMAPITIDSPAGTVLCLLAQERLGLYASGEPDQPTWHEPNVDAVAHRVFTALHHERQIVHPAFLQTDLVEVAFHEDRPRELAVTVPEVGMPESMEQLHEWVVASFQAEYDSPLEVEPNGDLCFVDDDESRAVVSVRNECRVEVWSVLSERGDPGEIRRQIDRLAPRYPGIRFHREDGRKLVISLDVVAAPFAAEQVHFALRQVLHLAHELRWVARAVERPAPRRTQPPAVPPKLAGLMANANRIAPALLVEAVMEAARDGRELRRWRSIARQELRAAKRLPDGPADPYRVAHRIRRAWERLERALDAALLESDISRRGEVA